MSKDLKKSEFIRCGTLQEIRNKNYFVADRNVTMCAHCWKDVWVSPVLWGFYTEGSLPLCDECFEKQLKKEKENV